MKVMLSIHDILDGKCFQFMKLLLGKCCHMHIANRMFSVHDIADGCLSVDDSTVVLLTNGNANDRIGNLLIIVA